MKHKNIVSLKEWQKLPQHLKGVVYTYKGFVFYHKITNLRDIFPDIVYL